MNEIIEVWIVKYALTKGIYQARCEIEITDEIVSEKTQWTTTLYHKNEWSLTKEGAIELAEKMKSHKIENLKKQIKKLENMTFA